MIDAMRAGRLSFRQYVFGGRTFPPPLDSLSGSFDNRRDGSVVKLSRPSDCS